MGSKQKFHVMACESKSINMIYKQPTFMSFTLGLKKQNAKI